MPIILRPSPARMSALALSFLQYVSLTCADAVMCPAILVGVRSCIVLAVMVTYISLYCGLNVRAFVTGPWSIPGMCGWLYCVQGILAAPPPPSPQPDLLVVNPLV